MSEYRAVDIISQRVQLWLQIRRAAREAVEEDARSKVPELNEMRETIVRMAFQKRAIPQPPLFITLNS